MRILKAAVHVLTASTLLGSSVAMATTSESRARLNIYQVQTMKALVNHGAIDLENIREDFRTNQKSPQSSSAVPMALVGLAGTFSLATALGHSYESPYAANEASFIGVSSVVSGTVASSIGSGDKVSVERYTIQARYNLQKENKFNEIINRQILAVEMLFELNSRNDYMNQRTELKNEYKAKVSMKVIDEALSLKSDKTQLAIKNEFATLLVERGIITIEDLRETTEINKLISGRVLFIDESEIKTLQLKQARELLKLAESMNEEKLVQRLKTEIKILSQNPL